EGRVGLELRVRLEEGDDARVGGRARRVRAREVAAQLSRSEDTDGGGRLGLHLALPLIAEEEEGPVAPVPEFAPALAEARQHDGAARCAAELVALEYVAPQAVAFVKERVGVQGVVAEELEEREGEVVRARLGHDADDAASVAPVLSRVVA